MLFISKKVSYQPLLDFLNEQGVEVLDKPMISFKSKEFRCPKPEDYEIVFFSSPRSVDYFLDQCSISEDTLIASIGRATSEKLLKRSIPINFEGVNSGNPVDVSKEFSLFVGGKKVLFPQSSRSNRTMQSSLPQEQVLDLVTYQTNLDSFELVKMPEIIVFTSPSNAQAFIMKNAISNDQKIIAWGKTTERFLIKNRIKVWETLEHSSFEELTELLRKYLR